MILGEFERYLQGVPFYRVCLTENRSRPVDGPISLFQKVRKLRPAVRSGFGLFAVHRT